MAKVELEEQQHDALEDAMVLREVFNLFKDIINKEQNVNNFIC